MVFYHVYVMGVWEDVVTEQAMELIFSGLYREATVINVGIGAKERKVGRRAA